MVLAKALVAVCDDLEKHDPNAPSLHFARGLLAAGTVHSAPITLPADLVAAPPIVASTAAAFGLEPEELLSSRRTAPIAEARFAAMLVLRRQGVSSPCIARILNRADHTTVLHGVARAEELERESPVYAAAVRAIASGDVSGVIVPPPPARKGRPDHSGKLAEIARAYRDGATILDCETQFKVTAAVVKRALRMHGVAVRSKGGKKPAPYLQKIATIMAMRAEGKTGEEIGCALGITRERVRQIVVKAGRKEEFDNRPFRPEEVEALEEYKAGASLDYLSAKLGVSMPTARGYLTRYGVPVRPSRQRMKKREERERLASQIAERYEAGENIVDIARAFGIRHHENIYRYLGIAGVKPTRILNGLRAKRKAA